MSAVTAVPLRPLAKGSVLKLWIGLALLTGFAAGLAWWSTRWLQPVTLDSGVRVQTIRDGAGPTVTAADVVAMRFIIRLNSPEAPVWRDSGSEGPFVGTIQDLPTGFGEGVQQMRAGGRYLVFVPASVILAGQPVPPRAGFASSDTLVFETQVLQIDAGQASAYQMGQIRRMMQRQQMMQSGPAGPGGPGAGPQGGPPAGATPPPPGG
ncbi:MAG TPA: hypothetical protein VMG08_01390 [Allosphingosinicella sp.]|nr:hypothetical protein [Allosphingosinicella sp.]